MEREQKQIEAEAFTRHTKPLSTIAVTKAQPLSQLASRDSLPRSEGLFSNVPGQPYHSRQQSPSTLTAINLTDNASGRGHAFDSEVPSLKDINLTGWGPCGGTGRPDPMATSPPPPPLVTNTQHPPGSQMESPTFTNRRLASVRPPSIPESTTPPHPPAPLPPSPSPEATLQYQPPPYFPPPVSGEELGSTYSGSEAIPLVTSPMLLAAREPRTPYGSSNQHVIIRALEGMLHSLAAEQLGICALCL